MTSPLSRRAVLTLPLAAAARAKASLGYWNEQRKGANGGLEKFRPEWFESAGELGLDYVRFSPDLLPAAERDFLIGDADDFKAINETDWQLYERVLDGCETNGLRLVMTMFSLPGCRWSQLNGEKNDYRMWNDERFQRAALAFWKQFAKRLRGHPAVVAYNPLNEPHPEREHGISDAADPRAAEWIRSVEGTTADVNRFNARMAEAIRLVDSETPILFDGWLYADPSGFLYNRPVDDPAALYALHNLGPWEFAAHRVNDGRFAYPGKMPAQMPTTDETRPWTRTDLEALLDPVDAFAERYKIPASRIVASEFWCDRRVPGAGEYLADEIALYNERGWHWSFYMYRGDNDWGGLDYELGTGPLGGKFWQAVEKGEDAERHKRRGDNPLWEVIRREFR